MRYEYTSKPLPGSYQVKRVVLFETDSVLQRIAPFPSLRLSSGAEPLQFFREVEYDDNACRDCILIDILNQ